MNFSLIKEIISFDKISILSKVPTGFEGIRYVLDGGIVYTEKDKWKNRRKILSKIFNFDFITSQIEMMVKVADSIFEEY